jgi:pimeloyl-ACP methyl ester carboxylesterase
MVRYRTVTIDGLDIFYRKAGPSDAPVLLLLHGFPSSSRMYEPLLGRLSDGWRLIAPDYPGFGHSSAPAPHEFAYTFDHLAEVMNHFTEVLGIGRYHLYVQDHGGPVGFRMAISPPVRLGDLIISSAQRRFFGDRKPCTTSAPCRRKLDTLLGPRRFSTTSPSLRAPATASGTATAMMTNRLIKVTNMWNSLRTTSPVQIPTDGAADASASPGATTLTAWRRS